MTTKKTMRSFMSTSQTIIDAVNAVTDVPSYFKAVKIICNAYINQHAHAKISNVALVRQFFGGKPNQILNAKKMLNKIADAENEINDLFKEDIRISRLSNNVNSKKGSEINLEAIYFIRTLKLDKSSLKPELARAYSQLKLADPNMGVLVTRLYNESFQEDLDNAGFF